MGAGDHILAIDNGTQSIRAMLFDPRGRMVARERVEIEPYVSKRPGWAEQDPEYYWRSLCEACGRLFDSTPVSRNAIAGVGLTTQRATMINLDANGHPLRPAIVWLDQRRTEGVPAVGGSWGVAFRLARMSETVQLPLPRNGSAVAARSSFSFSTACRIFAIL